MTEEPVVDDTLLDEKALEAAWNGEAEGWCGQSGAIPNWFRKAIRAYLEAIGKTGEAEIDRLREALTEAMQELVNDRLAALAKQGNRVVHPDVYPDEDEGNGL